MGGFHLSLDAILEGLGYAAPPIMALLFILDVRAPLLVIIVSIHVLDELDFHRRGFPAALKTSNFVHEAELWEL